MFDVAFIENTGTVRELCEVEVAAVIHLEETGWSVAGARSHDCVRMHGRISAAEVIRRVSASHWGIKVQTIGRFVGMQQRGWRVGHLASLRLAGNRRRLTRCKARVPQAAAKLASHATPPGQAVRALPCPLLPSPCPCPVCFAERRRRILREGASGTAGRLARRTPRGAALSRRRGANACLAGRSGSGRVALGACKYHDRWGGRSVPRSPATTTRVLDTKQGVFLAQRRQVF